MSTTALFLLFRGASITQSNLLCIFPIIIRFKSLSTFRGLTSQGRWIKTEAWIYCVLICILHSLHLFFLFKVSHCGCYASCRRFSVVLHTQTSMIDYVCGYGYFGSELVFRINNNSKDSNS